MAERLTYQKECFVDEYLIDFNGTKAAIRAGYSEHTAAQQASRLLSTVKIQESLAQRQSQLAEKRAWDLERVVEEAETNLQGSRTSRQWGSANGALEYIGRATGLVTDKPINPQQVHITRVTVVLSDVDTEGQQRVVESTSRELPWGGDEEAEKK